MYMFDDIVKLKQTTVIYLSWEGVGNVLAILYNTPLLDTQPLHAILTVTIDILTCTSHITHTCPEHTLTSHSHSHILTSTQPLDTLLVCLK